MRNIDTSLFMPLFRTETRVIPKLVVLLKAICDFSFGNGQKKVF